MLRRLVTWGQRLRRPRVLVPSLLTLALLGWGTYFAARQGWASYHYRAAQQAIARRDFADAYAWLQLCLAVWPSSAPTHLLAARTARRAGRYSEAEQHLRACLRLEGSSDARLLEDALLAAQRGNLAPVEGYLLSFPQGHPDAPLILEVLVPAYLAAQRWPDALHCVEQLLRREPDHVAGLIWRGHIRGQFLYSTRSAADDYRRALELDPENDEAHLRLAELLVEAGQAEEARPHFERLAARQPGDAAILLGLARCRRAAGQLEEAKRLLDEALQHPPQDARALTERGKLALEAGELADAERWLRQALAVAPASPQANYALAQCLRRGGKPGEAQKYFDAFHRVDADLRRLRELTPKVAQDPRDPSLRCEVGTILLNNHRPAEGLAWLTAALQQDPGHRATHATLATYYARAGSPARAAHHRRLAHPAGDAALEAPLPKGPRARP